MAFDTDKFAVRLREKAAAHSTKHCATFVRLALEAGGAITKGHLASAKTYGPILLRNGFRELAMANPKAYIFLKGDVVVIQNYDGGDSNGHIAGFDGKNWISDFVQRDFWPGPGYAKAKPSYVVYRP